MKSLENILTSVALIAATLSMQGAQATMTVSQAAPNLGSNIVAGQLYISEITIANSSPVATTFSLFDAPAISSSFTIGAFTNFYTTNGTQHQIYTNFTGVVQTNTNTMVYTVSQSVTGMTYAYRALSTITVGASATVTYRPVDGLITSYGVMVTNIGSTAGVITVTYANIR